MKALTVRQPWAHAILTLGKDVENRNWSTTYRGPLLIHAGLQADEGGEVELARRGFDVPGYTSPAAPRGAIVGVVQLVNCWDPLTRDYPRGLDVIASPWWIGRVGWLLRDPVAFPTPMPWKGAQGLFDVPDDQVLEHLRSTVANLAAHTILAQLFPDEARG